ncbi:hypothetical protein BDZ97DRAFT_1921391 [Flammula alnicola]|nr:hypothetical protein BDZ97DRAFT_1921391 [Flammula alnicola]
MLSRALPLITHRISFSANVSSTNPTITPRIEFPAKRAIKPKELSQSRPERELTPSITSADEEDQPANSDGESELSELSESDTAPDTPTQMKIPKPAGEPGRPRSGGYNIEAVLAPWGKEEFAKVHKLVKKLADLKLDNTKSYSKQNSRKVMDLCETVERHHTIVEKYEGHWPIRAMLKLYLKTTSENHRRSGKDGKNNVGNAV